MDVVGDLSWVEAFDGCGGQPELEDKEKITILVRDEQIKTIGIEKNLFIFTSCLDKRLQTV